jgi:hypothetical protein
MIGDHNNHFGSSTSHSFTSGHTTISHNSDGTTTHTFTNK